MQPTADFDPKAAAKKLMREARSGALATLMTGSGDPYCSLVNVATAADGSPLLLISRLAVHTKNILADPRVSLMLDERKPGDPLEGARVMLMGTARPGPKALTPGRRYLARQPEAEMFAGFADFALLPDHAQGRASGGRLRPHRRSRSRRSADRSRRRRRAARRRAGGDRAHECRPRRDLPALCHQAARRAGWRLALRRLRSGGARPAMRSARACGCRSRSG